MTMHESVQFIGEGIAAVKGMTAELFVYRIRRNDLISVLSYNFRMTKFV